MAFPIGNTIVSTIVVGNKYVVTIDHTGPTSYSQANGDVVNASDLGMGGFEFVDVAPDTSLQFQPYPEHTNGGYGNAVPSVELSWYALVTATLGGQAQTLGTEVVNGTNLSTFSVRLQCWCV